MSDWTVKKTEDGRFGLYNKTKKEMSKRAFKTKESATKMAEQYARFKTMKRQPKEKKVVEDKVDEE